MGGRQARARLPLAKSLKRALTKKEPLTTVYTRVEYTAAKRFMLCQVVFRRIQHQPLQPEEIPLFTFLSTMKLSYCDLYWATIHVCVIRLGGWLGLKGLAKLYEKLRLHSEKVSKALLAEGSNKQAHQQ